jgi:hypothetical protein
MRVGLGQTDRSSLAVEMAAASSSKIRTSGGGSLKVGYATVEGGGPWVSGVVVYALGRSEVSVPAAELTLQFSAYVERGVALNSGIAVVNPGEETVSLQAVILQDAGTPLASATLELGPRAQKAHFVNELFSGLPAEFTATLQIRSDQPFAALGLRQRQDGTLASVPGEVTAYPEGISIHSTGNPELPVVATDGLGRLLMVKADPEAADEEGRVTGVVFRDTDGQVLEVWTDDSGRPQRAVMEGWVFSFENYTDTRVDVISVSPEGSLKVHRALPLPLSGAAARSVRYLKAGPGRSVPAAWWEPALYEIGSHALSAAGCLIPLLAPGAQGLAIYPCGAFLLKAADTLGVVDLPDWISTAVGSTRCVTGAFFGAATAPLTCLSLILSQEAQKAADRELLLALRSGQVAVGKRFARRGVAPAGP